MKKLLLLTAMLLGLITSAIAQQPPPSPVPSAVGSFQGNELLRCTASSGSACNIILNHVRNTTGYLAVPAGTAITTAATWYNGVVIATGTIGTSWGVTFPNPAPDGMPFTLVNGTAAAFTTLVSVTATTGPQTQTLNAAYTSQTLAAGGSAAWLFLLNSPTSTTGVWYRIR